MSQFWPSKKDLDEAMKRLEKKLDEIIALLKSIRGV